MRKPYIPERIDWATLANKVGAEEGRGGSELAQQALESVLGEDNIANAVEVILDWQPGCEIARSVLRSIHSLRATEIAYEKYKVGNAEQAVLAVALIQHIHHPRALDWIEEFLNDDIVAAWGASILDQLIWSKVVKWDDPRVVRLLDLVESHEDSTVRNKAAFIREYMAARNEGR